MKRRYYVVAACDVGFGHGDELHLIKLSDGRLIGYSSEFDSCTTDIADACASESASCANWFGWDEEWQWRAATFEEIKALGLGKYVIGSKKDMKLNTPIEPL
ncbi:hypothetical protein [Burkholderia contaminans]|uniref:hypothetical protein n=1 Tax=Burkholderia contaminans TaxID=488447 RepID=UPI000F595F4E|nr:hypothetical protein [Burkholderia contaminans]